MLFNSYVFLFAFLPVALIGFYGLGNKDNNRHSIIWLVIASLFFYSYWNPSYLLLISFSILFNFILGIVLSKDARMSLLAIGIVGNIGLLAYYKYTNFALEVINNLSSSDMVVKEIILPLAISFFTFQQIAYLVDTYRGETKRTSFLNYCLFVTFFPQLIAGPIVHHRDILPQFNRREFTVFKYSNLSIGMTVFFIGLFKKCILADGIADFAIPVFDQVERGIEITFFEAWGGALAYTFQLYFDFSGYSDMAVGLGRMFGIKLPINFFSPYKASNIIDFWRRWHLTLSQFLRVYLYIPLGGNKHGSIRRYRNLSITMILGGLWHGAGWNFVIWGALHAFYLVINHAWNFGLKIPAFQRLVKPLSNVYFSRLLTFTLVVFAWVVFRTETIDGSILFYKGMAGVNGVSLPVQMASTLDSLRAVFPTLQIDAGGLGSFGSPIGFLWVIGLMAIVWLTPNTTELTSGKGKNLKLAIGRGAKGLPTKFNWKPNTLWAIATALMAILSVLSFSQVSEFLYFQF